MLLEFLREHAVALQEKTLEHIFLSGFSLLLAAVIAIPLGIGVFRFALLRKIILPAGSISQTIPCIAMLGILIPILGLGNTPTVVVLTFYAIYPLLKSTYIGLKSVPGECLEAAEGLGFSRFQKLWFVELPLALPVIISGLRVATAMTIGIASIAALIGAGGLGDFIMQGLSLNNSSLILLGAIPTAFLALIFDYLISQIEIKLQNRKEKSYKFFRSKKSYVLFSSLILLMGSGVIYYKSFEKSNNDLVVIASKNFTESIILAEMMAQMIEKKTSLKVTRKFNLGTTSIVHQALLKEEIDLYPEYTGTAYLTVLKKTFEPEEGGLFEKVKSAYKNKFQLTWLEPFGFSNSQALAIHKDYAHHHQLHTLSALTPLSHSLNIAVPPDFVRRPDGLPGLLKAYGLKFKNVLQIDPSLMHQVISTKRVDVVAIFPTDGKLIKNNLQILQDDKKFYPAYQAAPVVRQSILEAHPEIYQALSPLFGFISQEKMMNLNYQVDGEGKSPKDVVRQFLAEFDFI